MNPVMGLNVLRFLIAGLVMTSLTVVPVEAKNPQKTAESYRGSDVERALSANESLLLRFRKERDQLTVSGSKTEKPYLVNNRINILNRKIDFLEKELARNGSHPPKLRPIPVRWKSWMDTDARRGYLMAWSSGIAKMLDPTPHEARAQMTQAALPLTVNSRPVGPAELRESAEKKALPLTVNSQPVKPAELRESPETIMLPVLVAPKPLSVSEIRSEALIAQGNIARQFSVEQAPVVPPVPIAAPATSEDHSHAARVLGKTSVPKTGKDWKTMSRADKEIYVLSVMGNLSKRDVFLMKPYGYYIQRIDKAVEVNPAMQDEYVHRILMVNAYESEPDTRKDLEKVWK